MNVITFTFALETLEKHENPKFLSTKKSTVMRESVCLYEDILKETILFVITVYIRVMYNIWDQIFHPKNQGSFITLDMFLGLLILRCFCVR